MAGYVFSSESVTEGHPDKMCDAISDALLDDILKKDRKARVAAETMVKTGFAIVAGEVTTRAHFDLPAIVRRTVREIGYTDSAMGFDADTCAVMSAIEQQSPDIAQGVSQGEGLFKDQGAGDQGLMFGYACDETRELMPAPIQWSHRLTKRLAKVRKDGSLPWLRPDGKSQVTVAYDENNRPVHVEAVVVSTQHDEEVSHRQIKQGIREHVIDPVLPSALVDNKTKYWINPTGRFVVGGPHGDAGLTGRKIIVDTYGGMGRHGGGAFSGKDPSKVDRSACYFARYVAKNIVAAKVAKRCEVQVAYAIGVAKPMGVFVTTFGTGVVPDDQIAKVVVREFDFTPRAIIQTLDLLKPRYRATAAYGHFGRTEKSFTWEQTNRADALAKLLLPKSASKKTKPAKPVKKAKASSSNGQGKRANGQRKKAMSANGKPARTSRTSTRRRAASARA